MSDGEVYAVTRIEDLDAEIAELKQQRDYAAEQAHGLQEENAELRKELEALIWVIEDPALHFVSNGDGWRVYKGNSPLITGEEWHFSQSEAAIFSMGEAMRGY